MTDLTRDPARQRPQALSAAVSAVLSVAAGGAAAQDAAAPPPTVTGLDEIIVTATKRAESLQDVSESIAAFDSDAIAMRGLQKIDDVAKYIPGLSLAQREPGGTTIVFRGVASSGLQFGAVSSSALYLDEQPITQSGRSPDPRFIDIERIEALRGPQGTLYGASSQSGTLRVITAKPDPSGFDAWAEAEVNSVKGGSEGYDVSAMVNLPLGERVSLRLVGFSAEDAGFIDNVVALSPGGGYDNADVAGKDVNTIETTGGRAALRLSQLHQGCAAGRRLRAREGDRRAGAVAAGGPGHIHPSSSARLRAAREGQFPCAHARDRPRLVLMADWLETARRGIR